MFLVPGDHNPGPIDIHHQELLICVSFFRVDVNRYQPTARETHFAFLRGREDCDIAIHVI